MLSDQPFIPSRPLDELATAAIAQGRALRRRRKTLHRVVPAAALAIVSLVGLSVALGSAPDPQRLRTVQRPEQGQTGPEVPAPAGSDVVTGGDGQGAEPAAPLPVAPREDAVPPTAARADPGAPTTPPVRHTSRPLSATDRLAFSGAASGFVAVFTAYADGSDVRQVTSGAWNALWPTWSPDGRRLAFYSDRDGTNQVYVVNADGSDLQRVTHLGGDHATQPAWSPDGTRIAFTRFERRVAGASVGPTTPKGIWTVSPSPGDSAHQVTAKGAQPAWSPDGQRLTYVDSDGLQVLNLADGATRRVAAAGANGPTWSPDGRRIAFGRVVDGREQIFVVDADGSGERALVAGPSDDSLPEWTPDGEHIVFTRDADGRAGSVNCTAPDRCSGGGPEPSGLWITAVEGGQPRPFFPTTARGDYRCRFAPRR